VRRKDARSELLDHAETLVDSRQSAKSGFSQLPTLTRFPCSIDRRMLCCHHGCRPPAVSSYCHSQGKIECRQEFDSGKHLEKRCGLFSNPFESWQNGSANQKESTFKSTEFERFLFFVADRPSVCEQKELT